MEFNNLVSELRYISNNACVLAQKGKTDKAKELEELLSELYEKMFSEESDIKTLSFKNADYDFSINQKFFQVTIRKDSVNKLHSLIEGIKENAEKYKNAKQFVLIFFRNDIDNEKAGLIRKFKSEKFNFEVSVLFLDDIINSFVYNVEDIEKYSEIIHKFYSRAYSFFNDQKGPQENTFKFIARQLSVEYESRENSYIYSDREHINCEKCLDFNFLNDMHLIIHGDPACGKTSLLKEFYYKCKEKGFFVRYYSLKNYLGQDFSSIMGNIIDIPYSFILIDASDEVPREYIKTFYKQINSLFINFKGRIITTVRTSCLEELKSSLVDSKFAILKLNQLSKKDILDDSKKQLSVDDYNKFKKSLENNNTLEIATNPFYYQHILLLIKEKKNIGTPYIIVKNTVERLIAREIEKKRINSITKRDLLEWIGFKSYCLVRDSKNSFILEEDLLEFKTLPLFTCDGNEMFFIHNVFKEYFCAVYLSKFNFTKIKNSICVKINKKYYLIPRYYNVIQFLLENNRNTKLYQFLINNFPEIIVNSKGIYISDEDAICVLNSLILEMSNKNYWGDDSLFYVTNSARLITNDSIRKEVIKYVDNSYFRTAIIYSLRVLAETPPIDEKLTKSLYERIVCILNNQTLKDDEYLISCCIDLIGKLNISIEVKRDYIKQYLHTSKSRVKHSLLSIMFDNNLSDEFCHFIAECSCVRMNEGSIDGTLQYLSKMCIKSFVYEDSYCFLLDFYSDCIKDDRHFFTSVFDDLEDAILKFDNLNEKFVDSIINLICADDFEKTYTHFWKVINKFNLNLKLFDRLISNDSHILYDLSFLQKIFNFDVEPLFIKLANKFPYFKSVIPSLLDYLEKNNIELFEKFRMDVNKYNLYEAKTNFSFGLIRNKVFELLFEEDPIRKIFIFFYESIKLKSLTKEDIRRNRYSEVWAEFPDFIYRILKRYPELNSLEGVNNFNFDGFTIFDKILNLVDYHGCEISEKHIKKIKNYILNWLDNFDELCSYDGEGVCVNNRFPTILSLILRYDLDIGNNNYLKLIKIPNMFTNNNIKLSNYLCEKLTKSNYIDLLKKELLNNKLHVYSITDFLEFLINEKYIDYQVADYVLSKLKEAKDSSLYFNTSVDYLVLCNYLEKTEEFYEELSECKKVFILNHLPDNIKVKLYA